MKITCALSDFEFSNLASDLDVVLYGRPNRPEQGSIAATLKHEISRRKLQSVPKAWDLLTIALSVISADSAGYRTRSPDGWTRDFELTMSVIDAKFWNENATLLQQLLAFLTTDRWSLKFIEGGILPKPDKTPVLPEEDCVVLLSGGLDSLIGTIDLVADGKKPLAVSQRVAPDTKKQALFAREIGGGLRTLQVNHNVKIPKKERPQSQRARSIIFLAYGVFIATTLSRYHSGERVTLYVCENGFISINPPLTGSRIGSLSTRTTHPVVFSLLQKILDNSGLDVDVVNPYQFKTKGEMLNECKNPNLRDFLAYRSTSCGRILSNKIDGEYVHCGRCVPCLVRRAAFHKWNGVDETKYYYNDLGIQDEKHAGFDDVRSMLIAIAEWEEQRTQRWLGTSLSSALIKDKQKISGMIERGMVEIKTLLKAQNVK